jgi:flagellar biosynthetic protein FliP
MIGIALFMTLFIMQPTLKEAYDTAVIPFEDGQMDQQEFIDTAMKPFRQFMYGQTQTKDVRLFMEIDGIEWDGELDSIPNVVLVPSFIVSELRTAFIIGFLIYVPFIVIDMVVASVLMSMGMMMLPPTTISLPFKILLFVLADGWSLVIGNIVKSFY